MSILNQATGLTPDELAFYRENGYVLAPGVFPPEETAALREEAHALARRLTESRGASVLGSGWGSVGKVTSLPRELMCCHNVQFHSGLFARLVTDPRLVDRAASILGPNVQLHHTKLFIKPPECGAPFPMHQDHPFISHERHTLIAAILHLDDAPQEKGCVRVVPGSHKQGPLPHLSEGGWHLPTDQYPVSEATPLPAKAGDVLFFSYLTIHGSGVNDSQAARTTLLVQMRDPTDHPSVLHHLSRGQAMMLRGVDPEADADPSVASESRWARERGAEGQLR
jgi:phytanoyl-CoA hydroxylase